MLLGMGSAEINPNSSFLCFQMSTALRKLTRRHEILFCKHSAFDMVIYSVNFRVRQKKQHSHGNSSNQKWELNNIKSPSTNCQGEVNHKLGSIVEDVDANGYPPVEQYRKTISEFADQVCGYGRDSWVFLQTHNV